MLFSWSSECGPDDPVLVVPWAAGPQETRDPRDPPGAQNSPHLSDASGAVHFIDLRSDPYALDEIPEAAAHPALAQALRSLNAARSPVFTAKCDAWAISDGAELEALALELFQPESPELTGFASYIDLVWRDRATFASFHQHQHVLQRLERRVAALEHSGAAAEGVIRPALLDFDLPQEGFAVTLYIKALALSSNLAEAEAVWSRALADLALTFRNRDLMPHTSTTSQPATTGPLR